MKIAISGTYSSGETTTSIAFDPLDRHPADHAKTMREILPEALPGKRLEDCTSPELFQLGMIRYAERAVHESQLTGGFISDGSSMHEWVYGKIRTLVGIHPDDSTDIVDDPTGEIAYFNQVIDAMGAVTKRHAKKSYDLFIHLPIEFDLVADGHRPVSERFRKLSDELLLTSLDELSIPYHVVGGSIPERLTRITEALDLPQIISIDDAIRRAEQDLARIDTADELAR